MRGQKGVISIAFVIVMAVASTAGAVTFMALGQQRGDRDARQRLQSLYIAEAGIEKGIWYLKTPTGSGGMGSSWRPTNHTESFGAGQVVLKIEDVSAGRIRLTSTGQTGVQSQSISKEFDSSGLPAAFNYALFVGGALSLGTSTLVTGQTTGVIFGNGAISVGASAVVAGGPIQVAPGGSVSGPGVYTTAPPPSPLPTLPALDQTYYNAYINTAIAGGPGVVIGSQSYVDLAVNGTHYVQGNVTLSGTTTGSGRIVASGRISLATSAIVNSGIDLMAGASVSIGTSAIVNNSLAFARTSVTLANSAHFTGTLVSAGTMTLNNSSVFTGAIYAAGSVIEHNSAIVVGSMVIGGSSVLHNSSTSTYNSAVLPASIPGIPGSGIYVPVAKSWKKL